MTRAYEVTLSMETNNYRSKRFIPLFISLLIHCILIFLLFTYKELVKQVVQPIVQPQEKHKNRIIPAQLILPQSPQVSKTITTPTAQPQPQSQPTYVPTHTSFTQPETTSPPSPADQETPLPVQQQEPVQKTNVPLQPIGRESFLKTSTADVRSSITPPTKKQSAVQHPTKHKSQRQLTLKDITKGLFKSMDQQQALIENETSTRGVHLQSIPDARALALRAYQTKTYNVLQQSVNSLGKSLSLSNTFNAVATLSITVDKKGVLKNLTLDYNPKNDIIIRLENHLRQAAYSAGLFPPIPSHLNETSITHTYRLHINVHAGTDFYYLSPATY